MRNDNCKGCLSDIRYCDPPSINEDGKCPCTTCLVKVTCTTLCYDAAIFLEVIRSETIEEIYYGNGRYEDEI